MQSEQNGGSDISGKKKLNTNKKNEHVEDFGICHQLFQEMDKIFDPEAAE